MRVASMRCVAVACCFALPMALVSEHCDVNELQGVSFLQTGKLDVRSSGKSKSRLAASCPSPEEML